MGTVPDVAMEADVITVVKGDLRARYISMKTTQYSAESVPRLRR
jgi:hypothetical protein